MNTMRALILLLAISSSACETSCEFQFNQSPSKSAEIAIDLPKFGSTVSSPLEVRGKINPHWLFEGQCPVKLLDANGKVLGGVSGMGDWQSQDRFTNFQASLTFVQPKTDTGTLVIEEDCPSGDCKVLKSFTVPIRFR